MKHKVTPRVPYNLGRESEHGRQGEVRLGEEW